MSQNQSNNQPYQGRADFQGRGGQHGQTSALGVAPSGSGGQPAGAPSGSRDRSSRTTLRPGDVIGGITVVKSLTREEVWTDGVFQRVRMVNRSGGPQDRVVAQDRGNLNFITSNMEEDFPVLRALLMGMVDGPGTITVTLKPPPGQTIEDLPEWLRQMTEPVGVPRKATPEFEEKTEGQRDMLQQMTEAIDGQRKAMAEFEKKTEEQRNLLRQMTEATANQVAATAELREVLASLKRPADQVN